MYLRIITNPGRNQLEERAGLPIQLPPLINTNSLRFLLVPLEALLLVPLEALILVPLEAFLLVPLEVLRGPEVFLRKPYDSSPFTNK